MGILGLSKIIGDYAPQAVKENQIKNYFGRKIAIDASMSIYQFLIAVRQEGNVLTNESGETTSHLMGIFYRTIRMIENGIKPLYVFDGKPPDMKHDELDKRKERREEAEKQAEKAKEDGDKNLMDKFNRRLVKVTKQHNEECKTLLAYMGVPYLDAPSEAEAQCAILAKAGKVYGTATEDMDCLTFGSPILLRHMTFSEARKMPIKEFNLAEILTQMQMSQEQFVDFCILMGCDYCESIKGIGPKRSIELIKEHKNIETIITKLDTKKYPIPDNWKFKEARELFLNPETINVTNMDFKWKEPEEESLIKYMCEEKGFNEERIKNGIKKMKNARNSITQGRLDGFFTILGRAPTTTLEQQRKVAKVCNVYIVY
ncbi:unnamed protein product [Gordionus sp. m RMFG-2023]